MEFCFGSSVHKLGEKLEQMLNLGWEIKNKEYDFTTVLNTGKTVKGIRLENTQYPDCEVQVTVKNKTADTTSLAGGAIIDITIESKTPSKSPVSVSGGGRLNMTGNELSELYGEPHFSLSYETEDVYEYYSGSLQMNLAFDKQKKVNAIRLREK